MLSKEDIVVSKIIRLEKKDIDEMMPGCSVATINAIIGEVLERKDLYPIKVQGFKSNLPIFRERYDV